MLFAYVKHFHSITSISIQQFSSQPFSMNCSQITSSETLGSYSSLLSPESSRFYSVGYLLLKVTICMSSTNKQPSWVTHQIDSQDIDHLIISLQLVASHSLTPTSRVVDLQPIVTLAEVFLVRNVKSSVRVLRQLQCFDDDPDQHAEGSIL